MASPSRQGTSCSTTAGTALSHVRVAHVSDETGVGAFATQPCPSTECVLREAPYVFAQSYATWNTAPLPRSAPSASTSVSTQRTQWEAEGDEGHAKSSLLFRCCFGCGAPLPACLKEECDRLDSVMDDKDGDAAITGVSTPPRRTRNAVNSLWQLLSTTQLLSKLGDSRSSEPPTAAEGYLTEVDVTGAVHTVYFCTAECEARALRDGGKRFVLTSTSSADPSPLASTTPPAGAAPQCGEPVAGQCPVEALRYPTYHAILHAAQHPAPAALRRRAWPSRLAVLSTLHSVARRCNERVWLLVLLLARELNCAVTASHADCLRCTQESSQELCDGVVPWVEESVGPAFRARLERLCDDYAEGAMQLLSVEQKSLLRFSWQLLTWWWVLCCVEAHRETTEQNVSAGTHAEENLSEECWARLLRCAEGTAFPLQLYLRLYWLTNANVHMYVVANPVYTLWCQWLADADKELRDASTNPHNDPVLAESCHESNRELFQRLYRLFHDADAWSTTLRKSDSARDEKRDSPSSSSSSATASPVDVAPAASLHVSGVALYDVATKLNHSCVPSVCFQPNAGAVEARVVALRDIAAGEELFTSYVRPDQFQAITGGDGKEAGVTEDAGQRDTALRRRHYLQTHYGFTCCCPLCSRLDEPAGTE